MRLPLYPMVSRDPLGPPALRGHRVQRALTRPLPALLARLVLRDLRAQPVLIRLSQAQLAPQDQRARQARLVPIQQCQAPPDHRASKAPKAIPAPGCPMPRAVRRSGTWVGLRRIGTA